MKIKMLTTSAGPDPLKNWQEGQTRDVELEEAQSLVDAKLATAIDPLPVPDADFAEGGFVAKHKGGGSWQIFNAAGEIVAEGLKKDEALAKVAELEAATVADVPAV